MKLFVDGLESSNSFWVDLRDSEDIVVRRYCGRLWHGAGCHLPSGISDSRGKVQGKQCNQLARGYFINPFVVEIKEDDE